MQKLEYSPGEFIYTTNASSPTTLESLPLTQPIDPFSSLASDQKALLHHFLNDASQITACHSGMQRDICKMLVPMALQTPSLLYATMALSAIHLQAVHNQSENVKSAPDIAHLMALSLEQFRKELQNPQTKGSDALLATARTLCLAEVHSGAIHPNSWRAHIEGAKALMATSDRQGGLSPGPSDGFRRYLNRCESCDDFPQDRGGGAGSVPTFYPGVVEGLSASCIQQSILCNEAFQHSALIQIHRRLRDTPASAPAVQTSVKRILECTAQIGPSPGLSPWVMLTTPLFIAGCEAQDEDRETVRRLLLSLHDTIRVPNVLQSLKFLEQYWEQGAESWNEFLGELPYLYICVWVELSV
ncbi:fungal specific transcription factor domain-containing protein [Aspergillus tanneri]|uniref:C6 finger domain protein n=1 Tax=Aspergillus tanneri TaxID=1220188 RepID=A0A5M9N4A8_9EURO|nr:uncharacterized protein ATNIH1004_000954 [Aspergillus tanneri]KAA8652053.1 hypothetical protein ATNIH1004_000954 [Aspergillus tanneri]